MIYSAKAEELGLIKIGFSKDPESRAYTLNQIIPNKIELLKSIKGTLEIEKAIHFKFQHLRKKGEWFHLTEELKTLKIHKRESYDDVIQRLIDFNKNNKK